MGILYLGPFSGFKNRTGNLVGYKSRGLDIIRSYVVPRYSDSAEQVSQRNKFLTCVKLGASLNNYSFFVEAWNSVKEIGQTYFSQFMKANVNNCTSSAPDTNFSAFPKTFNFQSNLSVPDLHLEDFDISGTVPALTQTFNNLTGYTVADFYLAFIASSPTGAQRIVDATLLSKNVPAYSFATTYALTISLDTYSKTLLTDYSVSKAQLLVKISGEDMPDLFSSTALVTL